MTEQPSSIIPRALTEALLREAILYRRMLNALRNASLDCVMTIEAPGRDIERMTLSYYDPLRLMITRDIEKRLAALGIVP